jgi:hypothetical protein
VLVLPAIYAGSIADGERALQRLRGIGQPIADVIGPSPYAGFQTAFDPLLAPGARNYWKTHNFATLDDELIDLLVEQVRRLPGPECEILLVHLGGAVSRRPDEATAFTGRDAQFLMNVHARWDDPARDAQFIAWAREVYGLAAPFASGGAYVNFMTQDERDRIPSAYGTNYDRLAAIKAKFDPTNLFRVNQNIAPLAAAKAPPVTLGEAPSAAERRQR